MEKKLIKEINVKVNSNQKRIKGSIFLSNTNLKKKILLNLVRKFLEKFH